MPRSRMVLIAILAVLLAFVGYERFDAHMREVRTRQTQEANRAALHDALARRAAEKAKVKPFDMLTHAIPAAYPRPASEWVAKEKQFHQKLLEGAQYDVIVAPLQVQWYGFDRATRAVMSAELAAAIEHAQVGSVLDPFLLAEALGDGQHQFAMEDLYRIADSVGAKRIVFGFVGHDSQGRMAIRLEGQSAPPARRQGVPWTAPITTQFFEAIPFDDEHPAIDSFEQRVPELLKSIGIEARVEPQVLPLQLDLDRLPASPRELVQREGNAASSTYTFILLDLLTPGYMEETRAHFAAKAFAATSDLPVSSAEFRALRARAYMLLGYRPAALRCLGSPGSIEEQEVLAALNGNLADVRRLALQERNPIKHLIAALDANRIAADFGILTRAQSLEAVKALGLPGPIWEYLVARATTEWNVWSQFDNAELKTVLDREFPGKGATLQDIVQGGVTVDGGENLRGVVELSALTHVREQLAAIPATAHRFAIPLRPVESDYLELLAAIGHDNLLRHVNFLSEVQGLPSDALAEAARIESIYRGNAYFSLVRARAERSAAERTNGSDQDSLLKAGYEDAFNAMYWEQGQSPVSSGALEVLGEIGRHAYGSFSNFYYMDIPYHPLYMLWGGAVNIASAQANGMAALRNATSEFWAVNQLLGGDCKRPANPALCDEVGKLIADRFLGDPRRQLLFADVERLHGRTDTAATLLRDSIKTTPNFWPSYESLGEIEYRSGRPQEAAKVFLSYPGFTHPAADNPVAVANWAADAGISLFGSGDFDLATPLLRIAATQGSGASAEMNAQFRLRLLQGDVQGAARLALERGQRYGDNRAFRDYFGMLHAANQSNLAWSGFNALVGRAPGGPELWESALAGHHRQGSSAEAVLGWVKQGKFASVGNHVSYAADYLVEFATTDRIPSKEWGDAVAELDRPVWQMDNDAHTVVRPDGDGLRKRVLGPPGAVDYHGELPIGVFERQSKHRVRSGLAYFVAAYRAIKLGEYSSASKIFAEAAGLYDMASPDSSYMLPYYAVAVARSDKHTEAVESILSRFAPTQQQFDYELALAAVAVAQGAPDQALQSLRLARYRRSFGDDRPVMAQFTYGDICEELYKATSSTAIRSEALDWARARERAEPWQAWSYALEVALTPDSVERKRAIAMLHYLDPQSAQLATLKQSEVDEAVKQFGGANIFLPREPMQLGPNAI